MYYFLELWLEQSTVNKVFIVQQQKKATCFKNAPTRTEKASTVYWTVIFSKRIESRVKGISILIVLRRFSLWSNFSQQKKENNKISLVFLQNLPKVKQDSESWLI